MTTRAKVFELFEAEEWEDFPGGQMKEIEDSKLENIGLIGVKGKRHAHVILSKAAEYRVVIHPGKIGIYRVTK